MNNPNNDASLRFLHGQARNFAAWMTIVAAVLCFALTFWISWPLGPDFVDEGGVTRVRLAIAMLAFSQALFFAFQMFYLQDILAQVKRLTDSSKSAEPEQKDS